MKKEGSLLILLVAVFLVSFASALNQSDIDLGFECLEDKAGNCGSLSTQELALTILATPDNIFDECLEELKDRRSGDDWGNVRDTALAVLALNHAGENTDDSEDWLLDQTRTPTDLEWFIQQDSNAASECVFSYDASDYSVNIGENKKIDNNAGPCLTRAQSNFWLRIDSSCYEKEFSLECDKDYIANLLYKSGGSDTIHVLDATLSSPAFGSVKLSVNSKCFGVGSCDYEATAWATTALLRTGHDISEFLPYLIARGENNERFLPNAFVYMTTNYNDYATQLVSDVKLGNYWEAPSSAYNKFYDTALALISLGSSSASQVDKSKEWLVFSQGSNGCWQNSVRDTAIVLWALEGRSSSGGGSGGGGSTTFCTDANFFCIPTAECPTVDDIGENYFCPSLSETCCRTENLQSCSALGGSVCTGNTVCTGNERRSSDSNQCCTGTCVEIQQENECEANFYTCANSCSDSQEEVGIFACDSAGQVCCKTRTTPQDSGGSLWWLWVLIILIIIVVLAIVFRNRIKTAWANMKSKKGGKGPAGKPATRPGPRGPPRPPARPGFAPVMGRPPSRIGRPVPHGRRTYDRRDKEMSETFKKLRKLSK